MTYTPMIRTKVDMNDLVNYAKSATVTCLRQGAPAKVRVSVVQDIGVLMLNTTFHVGEVLSTYLEYNLNGHNVRVRSNVDFDHVANKPVIVLSCEVNQSNKKLWLRSQSDGTMLCQMDYDYVVRADGVGLVDRRMKYSEVDADLRSLLIPARQFYNGLLEQTDLNLSAHIQTRNLKLPIVWE